MQQVLSSTAHTDWRVPAATVGEMPRGGMTVPRTTPVLRLERMLLNAPALTSVVIGGAGEPACLTRARFFAELTGPLGFGRSLYARRTVAEIPCPQTLVLNAGVTVPEATQAVLRRPAEQRYDDVVVRFEDGSYGTLCVADLFAELAHTHAFEGLHDALTGLANRRLFLDRLRRVHAQSAGDVAVLFVDIDDFKMINDGLGHDIGNHTLSIVAARLRRVVGASATVARMGGDEFAVLLEEKLDRAQILEAVEGVVSTLRRPLRVGDDKVALSASVGVALGLGVASPDELLRNADMAMYAAKRAQKGVFAFYEDGMHSRALERLELRSDLEEALDRQEFKLVYQPIIDLADEAIVGAEALLRWSRPGEGIVAPDQFIPLCERTGLIVPIGRWVLTEACHQAVRWGWEHPGAPPLKLSVNISPRQLQEPTFVADVAGALADSGLTPSLLVLEITEGVFIDDMDGALERLSALKRLGLALALDDFGAGFSSLGYLSRMPIDVLKLDRSFIARLGEDEDDERGLVAGIVALARSLELITVAEGVEEEEQVRVLQAIGCDRAQGYFYARPMDGGLIMGDAGGRRPAPVGVPADPAGAWAGS